MMNIWMINHYAMPPTQNGGTRHFSLAKYLVARGHTVTIFACSFNHFSLKKVAEDSYKSGRVDVREGVNFVWVPSVLYSGNSLRRFWNMLLFSYRLLFKKYRLVAEAPDIVIGSSPDLFAAFAAERLAKRYKVPFVFEVRDLWPETLVCFNKFSKRHPLIVLLSSIEKYLMRHSNYLITLLPRAKDYYVQRGYPANKISVLPNFIDLSLIAIEPSIQKNKKFTIMYAGSHGLANGLHTIIDAANILQKEGFEDKIEILLIGDGAEKQRLQALARSYNNTMVTFLDPVPKAQIYSVLGKADVFMILLIDSPVFKWGVSPNKLYDYLALGKPIIFGINSPNNPVKECQAGITIPPANPDALSDAIKTLLNTEDQQRYDMGQRGRQFVEDYHNAESVALTFENILEECVK